MKKDKFNETSNTVAGINTPSNMEDESPLDPLSDVVEEVVNNVKNTFVEKPKSKNH